MAALHYRVDKQMGDLDHYEVMNEGMLETKYKNVLSVVLARFIKLGGRSRALFFIILCMDKNDRKGR